MTRCLLAVACLVCAACDPRVPTAPVITSFTGMPTSLVRNAPVAITGSIGFQDPDADVDTAVFALVDSSGTHESPPASTGLSPVVAAVFPFEIHITPTVVGSQKLTVRLIDKTQLSSAPAELALDVN
jgi:hypothetical protein